MLMGIFLRLDADVIAAKVAVNPDNFESVDSCPCSKNLGTPFSCCAKRYLETDSDEDTAALDGNIVVGQ
jgi:hypothetical protein